MTPTFRKVAWLTVLEWFTAAAIAVVISIAVPWYLFRSLPVLVAVPVGVSLGMLVLGVGFIVILTALYLFEEQARRALSISNRPPASERDEINAIVERKADSLAEMAWDELDAYGTREERAHLGSGRRLRLTSEAFWDMEPWASGMNISVAATIGRGPLEWSYSTHRERGGPGDPIPDPPGR